MHFLSIHALIMQHAIARIETASCALGGDHYLVSKISSAGNNFERITACQTNLIATNANDCHAIHLNTVFLVVTACTAAPSIPSMIGYLKTIKYVKCKKP